MTDKTESETGVVFKKRSVRSVKLSALIHYKYKL